MTPELAAAIRSRATQSSEGPFTVHPASEPARFHAIYKGDGTKEGDWLADDLSAKNADFFAHARDDIDALLADNARLQNLVAGLLEEGAARDRVVEAARVYRHTTIGEILTAEKELDDALDALDAERAS